VFADRGVEDTIAYYRLRVKKEPESHTDII